MHFIPILMKENFDHTIKKDSVYQWITANKVTGIEDKVQSPENLKFIKIIRIRLIPSQQLNIHFQKHHT